MQGVLRPPIYIQYMFLFKYIFYLFNIYIYNLNIRIYIYQDRPGWARTKFKQKCCIKQQDEWVDWRISNRTSFKQFKYVNILEIYRS